MNKKKPLDRIESLKAFIANQEDKLAKIKTVQTINAKMEAARKKVEGLEAEEVKRREEEQIEAAKMAADKKRKDEQRAKILLGAGLQMLDQAETVRIRAKILDVLNDRDRKWLNEYIVEYKVAWSAPEPIESDAHVDDTQPPIDSIDPAAAALMRALKRFDPLTLSQVESECLGCSEGTDRDALEVLFAALGKRFSAGLALDDNHQTTA